MLTIKKNLFKERKKRGYERREWGKGKRRREQEENRTRRKIPQILMLQTQHFFSTPSPFLGTNDCLETVVTLSSHKGIDEFFNHVGIS